MASAIEMLQINLKHYGCLFSLSAQISTDDKRYYKTSFFVVHSTNCSQFYFHCIMKNILLILFVTSLVWACKPSNKITTNSITANNFIRINGCKFLKDNQPYFFIGANFWAAMNLGYDNKERLVRELDKLQNIGINNLRVIALTEGPETEPYRIVPANNNKAVVDENILKGLDFLLDEMRKRNMLAVICLSNYWPWSGGFAQYQKWVGDFENIDYPMDTTKAQNWDLYMDNTAKFYSSKKAVELYNASITQIINRTNTVNHLPYKNDATIMSWQLCNEPRGMKNVNDYLQWIENTGKLIKQLDSNHLVTVGSEGLDNLKDYTGTPFIETHQSKYIDYTTVHLWVQNWNWYNPNKHNETYDTAKRKAKEYLQWHIALAQKLNKPLVLEEFGIGRDNNSHNPAATTTVRDDYYNYIFNLVYKNAKHGKVVGANFWAWSGEGKPRIPACWWHKGDDLTGDPPHEAQGWYSVYDSDTKTQTIIKKYAVKMAGLK